MESAFNTEAPIQGQANNEEHFPSSRDVRLPHLAFHRYNEAFFFFHS